MRPLFRRAPPPAAVRFAVLALGALCAGAAMTQSPSIAVSLSASPNPSTTGNYTVSGSLSGARPASFTSYRLREVGSSGPIGYYGISNPASFSFSLSGKAVGSYTYRAQRCFYTPGSSSPPRCENLGNALTVRVVAPNTAPVANAGADGSVAEGGSASLDGSGSSDADNDTLTYAWTQTSGTSVTLSSATAAKPSFTAPELLANQNLVFSLTVNDGKATSAADSVTVTVTADNDAPTANAGADRTVDAGASVTLSGSGSDPEKQSLSYAWSQTSGTSVTLSGASTASASFTAPDSAATLTFSLTVGDGVNTSAADAVTVTVTADNDAPTANAGADRTVDAGASVTLSGSGSDPEKQSLSYAWSQTSGTSVTLSSPSTASASFTAPDSAATLTFSLTVSDGVNTSAADAVTVTVRPPPNTAPVARAGADTSVGEGNRATLDGSGSRDDDGDSLTYAWTQTSGTTVTLSGATAAKPSFTAPELLANQNLVFSLTVNDGKTTSAADSVTVTVTADNDAPTANAGADRTVPAGASVTLSGSGSDPEKQSLTYAWAQTLGTSVTLSGASTASASFTAPDSAATLTFSLTVGDGVNTSAADSVTVTVRPPADRTPSFGAASVPAQAWTAGKAIAPFTLPSATGGDAPVSHGAGGLPKGVAVSPELKVSGMPTRTGAGTATLTARDADGDTATLTFAWTVGSPNEPIAGTVLSASPASPAAVPDYTVSARHTPARSYHTVHLIETDPWGTVTEHHVGATSFDRGFRNRVNGSYRYRLRGCYAIPAPVTGGEVCEHLGDALTVTVEVPDPDSMAAQLNHAYEARVSPSGDALRIERTSTARGGGQFTGVVLKVRQAGSETEDAELASVEPESATADAGMPAWTVTTAVGLVINDVNLDGFADVLVRGLGKVGEKFSNVDDQILYAPGRAGGAPSARRAVDDALTDFLTEVGAWTKNPSYFRNKVETRPRHVQGFVLECWVDVASENLERYCRLVRRRVRDGNETVHTNKSAEARRFAEQFGLVDGRIDPGVAPGGAAAKNIDRILSGMLGADILNGRLERDCNGFFHYDSSSSVPCNDGFSLGRIMMQTATELREDIAPDAATDRRRVLTPAEKTMARDSGLGLTEAELGMIRLVNAGSVIAEYPEAACIVSSRRPKDISCTDPYFNAMPAGLMLHELAHVAQFGGDWRKSPPADWQIVRHSFDLGGARSASGAGAHGTRGGL